MLFSSNKRSTTGDRSARGPIAIGLGALGAAALVATTLIASLGGFTATIQNTTGNTAATGTLLLTEGNGSTTCLSTASTTISSNSNTCTTIDDFGGLTNAGVGSTSSVTLTMENSGSIAASALDLIPGTCSAQANTATNPYAGSDTTGFCGKIDVTIQNTASTSTCVYPASTTAACPTTPTSAGTLAGLSAAGTITLPGIAPGSAAAASYKVTVLVDSSATNADQGLSANLPLTWQLSQ